MKPTPPKQAPFFNEDGDDMLDSNQVAENDYQNGLERADRRAQAAQEWRDDHCMFEDIVLSARDNDDVVDAMMDLFNGKNADDWSTAALKLRDALYKLADDEMEARLAEGHFDD
jgi:hypothetical protein